MAKIAFIVSIIVAIACVALAVMGQHNQQVKTSSLVKALQAANHQMSERITNLNAQIDQINVPTDPLSAYDDICNTQATNNSTDLTQTYYYPCTNNVQTIPQPGN